MANFQARGSVASQIYSQHVHGDINNNYICTSTTSDPLSYDLGIRFGQAPRIDPVYFIGRDHELEQLQTWLVPTQGQQKVVVLHGMGGIGKTQLSIHFVRQTSSQYTAVFWLNAQDEKTLKAGLATIAVEAAEALEAVTNVYEEEQLVRRARQWLSRPENNKWLLVYDNYDNPKLSGISSSSAYDICNYFPFREQGSILITTRSPRLMLGRPLPLKNLQDEGQSLSILAVRSHRSVDNDNAALKLVQRLDGLPLALATAGIYLSQSADSFEDYLQLYTNSWNDLQQSDNGPEDYKERTLYSTWNISFQRIQQEDHIAAKLLTLMAYFDNHELWDELFFAGQDLDNAPAWWNELTQSRPRFQKAIARLQDYSLIEKHQGKYSLHPCVHDWALEYINRDIDPGCYLIAVHSIAQSVKVGTHRENWLQNRRILPHALRLQHHRLREFWRFISPTDQNSLGNLYIENDMYQEARQMYEQALAGREKALGLEHILTLETAHNLGHVYLRQDKLADAERMYKRALAGYDKVYGPEHTSTLSVFHSLGFLYHTQNNLVEAEQMYERAQTGYERALKSEQNSALAILNVLGVLYTDQGKLVEAEQTFNRALAECENTLGPNHSLTLWTANNLGNLCCSQKKGAKAKQMYNRALSGFERTLGLDHPSTLEIVYNLAGLLFDQDNNVEAERMFDRTLAGFEKIFGLDHPSTLRTINRLGVLYVRQGKLTQAEKMFEQALAGREKTLGADHLSTLRTIRNLGLVYAKQGKLAKAEQMFRRTAEGRRKVLGPLHPETRDVLESLRKLNPTAVLN